MERRFTGLFIPQEILENEELSVLEMVLFAEIDSFSKNGECYATNDHFAKHLRIKTRQVQHYIRTLKEKGFIDTKFIYKKGSAEIEKRIITPLWGWCRKPQEVVQKTAWGGAEKRIIGGAEIRIIRGAENCADKVNKNIIKKQDKDIKSNLKEPMSISHEFETLWALYPNKKGKDKALKSYERARKNKDFMYEIVKNGIEMYKKYINFHGLDKTKIKHGSTWFNQKGWEDEYQQDDFSHSQKYSKFTQLMLNEMEKPDEFLADIGVESYEPRRDRKIISHD